MVGIRRKGQLYEFACIVAYFKTLSLLYTEYLSPLRLFTHISHSQRKVKLWATKIKQNAILGDQCSY